jgi:hypothetical protein
LQRPSFWQDSAQARSQVFVLATDDIKIGLAVLMSTELRQPSSTPVPHRAAWGVSTEVVIRLISNLNFSV